MALDGRGLRRCRGHCYWSRGWDLASPGALIAYTVSHL